MMEINADLKNLHLRSHRLEKQPIFVLQYWITIETDVEILALDGYKVQKEKLLKRIDFAFRFLFCKSNHDSRKGGFGQVKANLRNISSQTQPLMN